MEIIIIEKDCLYAVKYPDQEHDEYNRIFEDYGDLEKVEEFFELYKWEIGQYYVTELGWNRDETQAYAQKVIAEAEKLEDKFEDLIDNTIDGINPGLSSEFLVLEGFENKDMPAMKSYGMGRPALLRVYAVEVSRNCLIIFYSGIKIQHEISNCPVLKDNVIQKARQVINFLEENEITCKKDLNDLIANMKQKGVKDED